MPHPAQVHKKEGCSKQAEIAIGAPFYYQKRYCAAPAYNNEQALIYLCGTAAYKQGNCDSLALICLHIPYIVYIKHCHAKEPQRNCRQQNLYLQEGVGDYKITPNNRHQPKEDKDKEVTI